MDRVYLPFTAKQESDFGNLVELIQNNNYIRKVMLTNSYIMIKLL